MNFSANLKYRIMTSVLNPRHYQQIHSLLPLFFRNGCTNKHKFLASKILAISACFFRIFCADNGWKTHLGTFKISYVCDAWCLRVFYSWFFLNSVSSNTMDKNFLFCLDFNGLGIKTVTGWTPSLKYSAFIIVDCKEKDFNSLKTIQ